MTRFPITEYKMSIDLITRDHELLNKIIIDFQRQLSSIPDVEFEISPLLGRVIAINELPKATIFEGEGL